MSPVAAGVYSRAGRRLRLFLAASVAVLFGVGLVVALVQSAVLAPTNALLYGLLSAFGAVMAFGRLLEYVFVGWPVSFVGAQVFAADGARGAAYCFGALVVYTVFWVAYFSGGILAVLAPEPLPGLLGPFYAALCSLGCVAVTVKVAGAARCVVDAGDES